MIQRVLSAFKGKFLRGGGLLIALTFGSYLMGFIRDRLLVQKIGAVRALDIFHAAFNIPDLLLNIFIAGALSAAFVPVFTHLWSDGKHEEADSLATTVLHGATLTIVVMGTLAFIFMPLLTPLVAKGFSPQEMEMLIKTSRLMLISPLIFAISNTFGNMLVSFERFLAFGLSPILYNLGIIIGIYFSQSLGMGISGLVLGTILGALLHLFVRIIALFKTGFRLKYPLQFRSQPFRRILKLMLPKMLGQPVEQLTFIAFTNVASLFAAGSIVMMDKARNFQSVAVSVFGISLSVAIFSAFSRDAAIHNRKLFLHNFWKTTRQILVTTLVSAVFFFLFGELVIRILFGGGKFGPEQIATTGTLLSFFALAIPTESMIHLLARAFYAMKDTVTPVLFSLVGLGLILLSVNFLKIPLGLNAIPISFFIGSFIEVVFLFFILLRRLKDWDTPQSSRVSPS